MIALTLREVATAVGGRLVHADFGATVTRVTTDSREVASTPATLFVARRGEVRDGHDFAASAVAEGAVAVLAERAIGELPAVVVADSGRALAALAGYVRDRLRATVIGVTGSVGKTTTKDLIRAACATAGPTVAATGSYNNEVGVPLTVLAADADTRVLVTELGARGVGQIAELCQFVRPRIGVVTAVAGVHLELFGSVDDIAVAKSELVAALPADGTAVLNGDDVRVAGMREVTAATVMSCSAAGAADADVVAHDVRLDTRARPSFEARTPWGDVRVRLPVAGRHNVANALLALTAAGAAGVDVDAAAAALADAPVSDWRGAIVELDGAVVLDDAYNANPTSTMAALDTLASLEATGRRTAVLGVMAEIGDGHDREHRRVGVHAASRADRLVVVGDAAAGLAEGAREAGMVDVVQVPDAAAAAAALGRPRPGDAVLVKGSRVAALDRVTELLRGAGTKGRRP